MSNKDSSSSKHSKDLWKIAQYQVSKDKSKDPEERTVLFVGSENGGKSTIILQFLDRDTPPKPTVALEYNFGRKGRGHDMVKDIVHMWELGGGTELANLVEVPITAQSLKSLSVVVAIDLSKPERLWTTATTLIDAIKSRIQKVMDDLSRRDSKLPPYLQKKARSRLGEDHPDKDMINALPVPLLIIGTKYDKFQKLESEPRKMVCRALRFLAHMHGASLLFTGQEASLKSRCRAQLAQYAFKIPFHVRNPHFEHDKPMIVPVGADTLAGIGAPPQNTAVSARTPMDLWKGAYEQMFPAQDSDSAKKGTLEGVIDPGQNPEFAERAVDTLYQKKLDELERFQKQVERRARENRQLLI